MPRLLAQLDSIRHVTPSVLELTLARPGGLAFTPFTPGQYATLSFPEHSILKAERSFSIASAPSALTSLQFGIRTTGRYTRALRDLVVGECARVTGPYGSFTFDAARDRSALFIAGGIGVTPFLSMVREATARQLRNELVFLYSVRSVADIPFREELDALERANPHVRIVYAVSDRNVSDDPNRFVRGRISRELIAWAMGSPPAGYSYFLCGPPPFMQGMTRHLTSLGVLREDIAMERFSVGNSAIIEGGTPIPKLTLAAWGSAALLLLGVIVHQEAGRRDLLAASHAPAAPAVTVVPEPTQQVTPPSTVMTTTPNANAASAKAKAAPAPVQSAPVSTPKAKTPPPPTNVNATPTVSQPKVTTPVVPPPSPRTTAS